MRTIIAAAVAVALIGMGQLAAQEPAVDHVLDVAGAPTTPESDSPSQARPFGGVVLGPRRPVGQLKVSLVSLDRDSYDTGGPVLFDVLVQNVGSQAIAIPWSPDIIGFADRPGNGPEVVRGSLFLEVRRPGDSRNIGWLESQMLVGASDVPNSLLQLMPGKRALLRARGYWRVGETELAEILATNERYGSVEVYAVLDLSNEGWIFKSANGKQASVRSLLRR